jgi:hypothetical protein
VADGRAVDALPFIPMSAFPEIYLDPINRQAAEMFGTKKPDERPAKMFVDDVQAKLSELDAAISSIKRQLRDRNEPGTDWHRSATHALCKYYEQKKSVLTMLKTARAVLEVINLNKARADMIEKAGKYNESLAAINREKHEAKERRIALSTSEQERWCAQFKKVCKNHIGEARYLELVEITNALLET